MTQQEAANMLWIFLKRENKPEPSDAFFVFGGWNMDIAARAAELYNMKYAPVILVSGNKGMATAEWDQTEAERFAEEMERLGVPRASIILEKEARNSEDNTVLGMARLLEKGITPSSLILIGIPFMMQRCAALFHRHRPKVHVLTCPPSWVASFEEINYRQ